MKRYVIVSLLAIAFSPFARGDGNDLLRQCGTAVAAIDRRPDQNGNAVNMASDTGFCFGFVQGVTQMHLLAESFQKQAFPMYCSPEQGISNGQGARVIEAYLRKHPELLHLPEIELTLYAYKDAFPCKAVPTK